jgi:predicted O-linked N-acetylglucosamine transferase (SPINDLY family)
VELEPNAAEAHSNLGNVLRRLGRLQEAETHNRRAVELKPDLWPAINNLGALLNDLDRRAEALALYRDALSLKPDNAVIWYNVGSVLADMRRLEEAVKAYRRAYELDPSDDNVAAALAIRCQQICDWKDLERLWRQSLDGQVSGSADPSPFSLLSMPSKPAEQLVCARRWGHQHSRGTPEGQFQHRRGLRERLRIGYLSADFRKHAVAYLAVELVELHDRQRFEVFGYSYGPDDGSAMRARLAGAFDRFSDVRSEFPPHTAQRIYEDGVDILVDLTGITQHCRPRILAHRPAPIQVNYLGYPGTMGAEFIDYILVDRYIVRPEEAGFYSEKVVWLPDSYQVNDRRREVSPRTPTRAECGLPEQGFVFCCFNNTFKINPETFDSWMRILKQVEGSVLWLIGDNALAERNLRREAEARGVDAARLVFAPRCEMPDHLARQKLADLFLDTLPYTAHTTTSDALWVGLPVVTLAGDTFAARVAGSLLLNTGLPELITHNRADYEALALRLAQHPTELQAVLAKLAAQAPGAPLFDAPATTRAVETAYQRMWALYEAGRPPEPMSI